MTNNNKKGEAQPDPKTQSNATRVNDPVRPNPGANDDGPQDNGQAQPDPKTLSNATRVNDQYRPNPDGTAPQPQQNSEWNPHGNPVSKKSNELDPSSDQPNEIARKEREQEAQKEDGRKKRATEGGENDTSHATIGKNEEKEAREQNKDKKADSKHSKKK